ncbi:MAG: transposase [Kiritimatiellae bacterium]|nr:transposase [Kiritimatiellia bacterium]MCB1101733.1 transposase [Kiritimatiellia bacterium]
MPRANRYLVAGPAYHVTHRCHNRAFLFRFARDRDAYRTMLRDQIRARGDVEVLTYCITSNHVHLLLTSRGTDEAISALMQALEGEFAQFYNRRKKRTGAFWGGRFHATMIDSGEYLWRCMRYIDLNMVRAGVVSHPAEWAWTGYREIAGLRCRYRVVSLPGILERTGQLDADRVVDWYKDWINDSSGGDAWKREAKWTESIAVGSREFVESIGRRVEDRMNVRVAEDGTGGWLVKEHQESYSHY